MKNQRYCLLLVATAFHVRRHSLCTKKTASLFGGMRSFTLYEKCMKVYSDASLVKLKDEMRPSGDIFTTLL